MKCENCGKNETTFHYTSNINGTVTERHLCSECAAKLGYTDALTGGGMLGSILRDFLGDGSGAAPLGGLMGGGAPASPFGGLFGDARGPVPSGSFGVVLPAFVVPGFSPAAPGGPHANIAHGHVAGEDGAPAGLDDTLKKQLEINKLREQMAQAAQSEDFETAAQIRDKIKSFDC
ncbi:MAG: UvrB/UvrC motif-containing protein [Oscillospiraceae bacterium]|jgi:protein arginine kinase activator|nr:UvrB/UvrC motif-containing protein [Oscillospiraceae bacterium]